MTPERLATILEAYGANPERWPEAERADALQLLSADAMTRQMHEEEELDALLGRYQLPVISAVMKSRAFGVIPTRVDLSILRRWWVGLVVSGAGLAGVAAGVLTLMVLSPGLEDRQSTGLLDEQLTIFTPFDIEEDAL